MCCSTGFHRNYAGGQVREKCQHMTPRQLFANSNAAISCGAVNLENPLCQIEPNDGNLFYECFLLSVM